jgi:hypothetical protein
MKAIVQTYDRNSVITEHMIRCYEELWPGHPFTFRIPFQDPGRCVEMGNREYIQTDPGIKKTVLGLLQDLDDEEWIYWCIDDKYPVKLDVAIANEIYEMILGGVSEDVCAVMFCNPGSKFQSMHLVGEPIPFGPARLIQRQNYNRIWLHQFARVRLIRHLFRQFPEQVPYAKLLDDYVAVINKPAIHRTYMTESGHAVFGESMSRGNLTRNCHDSLLSHGFSIPSNMLTEIRKRKLIGEWHKTD